MLEVTDIKKKYKNAVLRGVSLSAQKGECLGIFGANGCGKTTLLEILAGSRKPDGGSIRVFGKDPLKNKSIFSKYIGYVPQENPLVYDISVYDNIRLWFGGSKKELEEAFKCGVLGHLGLWELRKVKAAKLSGGMKRRLAIGIGLLNNPPILLLDEPTTALDLKLKAEIRGILRAYTKSGGTIVMTSHDEGDLQLFTRLALLKDGELSEIDKNISGKELINLL